MANIKNNLATNERLSYSDIEVRFLPSIVRKLNHRKIDQIGLIIGLPRGGLYPAVRLSHYYAECKPKFKAIELDKRLAEKNKQGLANSIRHCIEKGKTVLYVDDIICSGAAFAAVERFVTYHVGTFDNQVFVALCRRESAKINSFSGLPIVYGERIRHKRWVDFFWEFKGFMS